MPIPLTDKKCGTDLLLFDGDEEIVPTREYRCTFPGRYPVGASPRDMQGHYVLAFSPEDAVLRLRKREEKEGFKGKVAITVELWKIDGHPVK